MSPHEKTSDLKILWVTCLVLPPSSTWALQRIGDKYYGVPLIVAIVPAPPSSWSLK